jgi:hypothetical protein
LVTLLRAFVPKQALLLSQWCLPVVYLMKAIFGFALAVEVLIR